MSSTINICRMSLLNNVEMLLKKQVWTYSNSCNEKILSSLFHNFTTRNDKMKMLTLCGTNSFNLKAHIFGGWHDYEPFLFYEFRLRRVDISWGFPEANFIDPRHHWLFSKRFRFTWQIIYLMRQHFFQKLAENLRKDITFPAGLWLRAIKRNFSSYY